METDMFSTLTPNGSSCAFLHHLGGDTFPFEDQCSEKLYENGVCGSLYSMVTDSPYYFSFLSPLPTYFKVCILVTSYPCLEQTIFYKSQPLTESLFLL